MTDVTRYTDALSALKFFPTKSYAIAAVATLLSEVCPTEREAARLVSLALERFSEWPGPGKLRELAAEIASGHSRDAQSAGCEYCRAYGLPGFRRAFKLIHRETSGEDRRELVFPDGTDNFKEEAAIRKRFAGTSTEVYEVAAFCTCEAGRQRREAARKDGAA